MWPFQVIWSPHVPLFCPARDAQTYTEKTPLSSWSQFCWESALSFVSTFLEALQCCFPPACQHSSKDNCYAGHYSSESQWSPWVPFVESHRGPLQDQDVSGIICYYYYFMFWLLTIHFLYKWESLQLYCLNGEERVEFNECTESYA